MNCNIEETEREEVVYDEDEMCLYCGEYVALVGLNVCRDCRESELDDWEGLGFW